MSGTASGLAQDGVSLGDWATVTNNATGQTTYARVEDKGPSGGSGEISEAAATGTAGVLLSATDYGHRSAVL